MELHERIIEQRRKSGLSQEELAGKLGVSRQAVGKWENGASMPDLNNLIELSHVFGLSLAELLGIEEPAAQTSDSDKASKELEELLKHYTYEQNQQVKRYEDTLREHEEQEAGRRRTQNILLCVMAAAVVIVGIVAGTRISKLNDRLDALDFNTRNSIDGLSNDIYSVQNSITGLLEAQASLFSDFSFDVTDYDAESGTVTVSIAVTPKSVTDGMQVEFVLTDIQGGAEYHGAAERAGTSFSALIQGPSGTYGTEALVTENGTQRNEELGRCYASPIGLEASYSFDCLRGLEHTAGPAPDGTGMAYHPCGILVLSCSPGEWPARAPAGIELVLYKNEAELARISLDIDDPARWMDYYEVPEDYLFAVEAGSDSPSKPVSYQAPDNGMMFVSGFDFGEIEVAAGDETWIELIVTDTLGLVYRESKFEHYQFRSNSAAGGVFSAGSLSLDYGLYE